jgi:hypothetical protein
MDNIARVIRHAARQLWRAPLVSLANILTLAIGIGACTLMLSVVSTVLLKPLPYGARRWPARHPVAHRT